MNIRLNDTFNALPKTVPFIGTEKIELGRGMPFSARLGANENLAGPSPDVVKAIKQAASEVWKYPDPDCHAIKNALSRFHGVDTKNVIIGEGIDGLLGNLVRMLASPTTPMVTSLGAYPTFAYHVRTNGVHLHEVPYANDFEDLTALLKQVRRSDANLVYVSNPDNPMGTFYSAKALIDFIEAIPDTCVICLDEAYAEYADADALLPMNYQRENLIRFRTFSKIYGLAGLRIGYGIGDPDFVSLFDNIRNHFGVNRLAEVAACAALEDVAYTNVSRLAALSGREKIAQIAHGCGLYAIRSSANFVAVDCGRDGAFADAVLEGLLLRGVFVRKPSVEPLCRCIRISVGTEREIEMVSVALPEALKGMQ